MFRRKLYKEVVAKQINKNNFDATEGMPDFVKGKKWKRRALGLFRLEKRRSRGYLAAAIHCQKRLWRREADSSHKSTGEGQEAKGTGYNREISGWIYRKKIPSHKSGTALGQPPERWWDLHPWRHSRLTGQGPGQADLALVSLALRRRLG